MVAELQQLGNEADDCGCSTDDGRGAVTDLLSSELATVPELMAACIPPSRLRGAQVVRKP
jgi:hypothetical protein